ncbi:hypothetical protein VTJ04DRAFT_9166 [Mycothermus thermophilus]|uniref:uncharacterized protein n=1 Tax=Humicola insolens TaxID=85995 RepID=UPI0037437BA8
MSPSPLQPFLDIQQTKPRVIPAKDLNKATIGLRCSPSHPHNTRARNGSWLAGIHQSARRAERLGGRDWTTAALDWRDQVPTERLLRRRANRG